MRRIMFHLALCWSLTGGVLPAAAKPLNAEACARLKLQRDALEQSGARDAVSQTPPVAKMRDLDDRAQQVRTLIDIDGQLRFRCHMDLPIASLRPELLVEVPDVVAGELAAVAAPAQHKKPAGQRKKAATPKANAETLPTEKVEGIPVVPKQKAAVAKGAAPESAVGATAAKKAPARVDDAYRAPAPAETKAGAAEKAGLKPE